MKYIFLIIYVLFSTTICSEVYEGPSSPGVEKLICGKYRIKGKFLKKKKQIHHLVVYPDTTRQYKIPVKGEIAQPVCCACW